MIAKDARLDSFEVMNTRWQRYFHIGTWGEFDGPIPEPNHEIGGVMWRPKKINQCLTFGRNAESPGCRGRKITGRLNTAATRQHGDQSRAQDTH